MFKEGFSSFSVADLDKAKKFYKEILELKVTEEDETVWLHLGNNKILMYPKENHVPATFTILNFPVTDLEKIMDELLKRGVTFEHYDMPDLKTDEKGIFRDSGIKIAWFKDSSGNILSILQED